MNHKFLFKIKKNKNKCFVFCTEGIFLSAVFYVCWCFFLVVLQLNCNCIYGFSLCVNPPFLKCYFLFNEIKLKRKTKLLNNNNFCRQKTYSYEHIFIKNKNRMQK